MKEKWGKPAQRICCLLLAFLSVYSISYLMNLRGGVLFSHSVWTLFLWVGMSAYYWCAMKKLQEVKTHIAHGRRMRYAGFVSLLFGVLLVAGYQLQWQGYTDPGYLGKAKLLIRGIFLGMALLPLMYVLFVRFDGIGTRREQDRPWRSLWVFLGSFLGIWLCWIPVWLAYYPVIMSYDFHKQSLNALLGPQYFDAHHPLAHTWLIYLFRNLGEAIGSYETGFAFFSLFQQLISALVLGYACVMIYRLTGRKWAVVVSALFLGCFPLVSVFVMCTTKDVLFGAFFVLFLLLFAERQFFAKSAEKKRGMDVLWVLSGILMMLFRNNAWYAMLVFGLFFVLLSGKKERLRAWILALLFIAGGKGALAGIQGILHSYSGSDIEKYSVIYQSMARVGKMQRENLSDETYKLLDHYVTAQCWESYNPVLADSIKVAIKRNNFEDVHNWDDMGEVLLAWLKIGLQYPNDYMDAFLDLTRGYWFLDDTSHAEMLGVGTEERKGLLYTYNIAAPESLPGMQHISKFPWLEERLESLLSANSYYRYPVISNLFKPALWCWLFMFYLVFALYEKNRGKILFGLYPAAYFATMLLGPTAIVRYVFPYIVAMPLFLALLFAKGGKNNDPQ